MKENNILIDDTFSLKEENNNYNKNLQNKNNSMKFKNENNIASINGYINTNKNSKKVKISDKVEIIDVECWKKYNLEQTADENIENYLEELERNEEQETKKSKNSKNKRTKSKTDNVFCTCILI